MDRIINTDKVHTVNEDDLNNFDVYEENEELKDEVSFLIKLLNFNY